MNNSFTFKGTAFNGTTNLSSGIATATSTGYVLPTANAVKEYALPLTAFGDTAEDIADLKKIKGLLNSKNLVLYVDESSPYTSTANYVLASYDSNTIGAYLVDNSGVQERD